MGDGKLLKLGFGIAVVWSEKLDESQFRSIDDYPFSVLLRYFKEIELQESIS